MLRFVDRREIESVEQLADVLRQQLRAAGHLYDGDDLPAEARLDAEADEGSFHGTCTLWRILDGDRHAYDAWLYMGDSGTIFRAGTTDKVAEIVQCGLECSDRRLRAELGPAMVDARLLPDRDASFGEFAELLAKQRAGVVLAPILAEGTMPATPHALAAGLEEVSRAELAAIVAAEIAPAPRRRSQPTQTAKASSRETPSPTKRASSKKATASKPATKAASRATASKPMKAATVKSKLAKTKATKAPTMKAKQNAAKARAVAKAKSSAKATRSATSKPSANRGR